MRTFERIKVFTDKYPSIGPTVWIVTVQYFITQLLAALAWPIPYSITKNAISDLGNSACGLYADRYVCSPYHSWMNASFIVLGATMIAGSTLIYQEFHKNRTNKTGFGFMALAGLGTILVGLFPENTSAFFHFSGALLAFALGNIALIIFAFSLGLSGAFKKFTIISGLVALLALPFFFAKIYFGFGFGGMERIVAYPQAIWLIAFGFYMTKDRFKKVASRALSVFKFSH
jgi:hypothetical membrane protein